MFDDPSGAGTAIFRSPLSGINLAALPGFVIAIPVRDEEERLPACLRARATARPVGPIDFADAGPHCRIRQQLQRSECKPRPETRRRFVARRPRCRSSIASGDRARAGFAAARRWTLQKRGLWKPARATA